MHPLLFQFGPIAIPTYGAFTALALVASLAGLVFFARRLGLNANKLWNLGLVGILTSLIAARVLVAAEYFSPFRAHPFWVLGLSSIRSGWVDPVAVLLGFLAALLYALAEGLPLPRVLDCIAPSALLATGINRVGAFFAGTGFGLPAEHGWGITYTNRLAALWYRTPVGVRVSPVQLYEAAAAFAIVAALLWRLPRRAQDGELWGAGLFLAGTCGFFLGLYRAFAASGFWGHQAVCVAMVLASAAFLVRWKSGAVKRSYTGVNEAQHI